ncbi:MAG: N-acetyltransferase family protein [Pseudomonadota bacterium]
MSLEFRFITDPDDPACAQIAALWTHYIDTSVVTFNPIPKTAAEIAQSVKSKTKSAEPMIAAFDQEQFLGFATYGPFRNGEGYKYSKEHTIMLSEASKGLGLGRSLMDALEGHAKANNIQSLWAGITGANRAAIAFHTRMGFEHVASIPEIGWKFDQWHDLVLMRKRLR